MKIPRGMGGKGDDYRCPSGFHYEDNKEMEERHTRHDKCSQSPEQKKTTQVKILLSIIKAF